MELGVDDVAKQSAWLIADNSVLGRHDPVQVARDVGS
jgi:hypothetical protein